MSRPVLLLRHDLQEQPVQDAEIQIFRPAEDHAVDPDPRRRFQQDGRAAAEGLGKQRVQMPAAVFLDIALPLSLIHI